MAKVDDGVLKQWFDGEVVYSTDYVQEREIMRLASNHNYEEILKRYTKTEIDSFLNAMKGVNWTSQTIKGNWDLLQSTLIRVINGERALVNHKSSGDHDDRYYRKDELTSIMQGGDTKIKYEVFVILSADNGDGTFTYQDADGESYQGAISAEGFQVFQLKKGVYRPNNNRIEAVVNDTLHRSVASGGLKEVDERTIALTDMEGSGAEITFKYFERIGLMGEHAVSHNDGGADEITGILVVSSNEPNNKFSGKLWGKVI